MDFLPIFYGFEFVVSDLISIHEISGAIAVEMAN